jgi:proteasome lid subunit RPN8/RPN11
MKNSASCLMPENRRKDAEHHAFSSPHREVCGFVYPDQYVRLTNISHDPNAFVADASEIAKCLSHYGEPLAIFHSHPNGSSQPSARDLQLASYYRNSTIIIGVIVKGRLELSQVVAPPQLDPEPAVQP